MIKCIKCGSTAIHHAIMSVASAGKIVGWKTACPKCLVSSPQCKTKVEADIAFKKIKKL